MTPIRQRKSDRLICPGAPAQQVACDAATAPFDRLIRHMERKWGIDRLPELVPPAMAATFGAAMSHLNDCLDRADKAETIEAVENLIKGIGLMDKTAEAAGHKPTKPEAWQFEFEGQRFALIREVQDWPLIVDDLPGFTILTLREVAVALASYRKALPAIAEIKAQFPGSQITRIRAVEDDLNDEIPW